MKLSHVKLCRKCRSLIRKQKAREMREYRKNKAGDNSTLNLLTKVKSRATIKGQ